MKETGFETDEDNRRFVDAKPNFGRMKFSDFSEQAEATHDSNIRIGSAGPSAAVPLGEPISLAVRTNLSNASKAKRFDRSDDCGVRRGNPPLGISRDEHDQEQNLNTKSSGLEQGIAGFAPEHVRSGVTPMPVGTRPGGTIL